MLEKIGRLTYRLNFPPSWRIYLIILVKHLNVRPGFNNNLFEREIPPPGPVKIKENGLGKNKFKVEIILAERINRRGRGRGRKQWLVRWKGWGAEHDSWVNQAKVFAPKLVRKFRERQRWRYGYE